MPESTIDVSATLADDSMNYAAVFVFNLDEEYVGTLGYVYNVDEVTQSLNPLPAGDLRFEKLDGTYNDETEDENRLKRLSSSCRKASTCCN